MICQYSTGTGALETSQRGKCWEWSAVTLIQWSHFTTTIQHSVSVSADAAHSDSISPTLVNKNPWCLFIWAVTHSHPQKSNAPFTSRVTSDFHAAPHCPVGQRRSHSLWVKGAQMDVKQLFLCLVKTTMRLFWKLIFCTYMLLTDMFKQTEYWRHFESHILTKDAGSPIKSFVSLPNVLPLQWKNYLMRNIHETWKH